MNEFDECDSISIFFLRREGEGGRHFGTVSDLRKLMKLMGPLETMILRTHISTTEGKVVVEREI